MHVLTLLRELPMCWFSSSPYRVVHRQEHCRRLRNQWSRDLVCHTACHDYRFVAPFFEVALELEINRYAVDLSPVIEDSPNRLTKRSFLLSCFAHCFTT